MVLGIKGGVVGWQKMLLKGLTLLELKVYKQHCTETASWSRTLPPLPGHFPASLTVRYCIVAKFLSAGWLQRSQRSVPLPGPASQTPRHRSRVCPLLIWLRAENPVTEGAPCCKADGAWAPAPLLGGELSADQGYLVWTLPELEVNVYSTWVQFVLWVSLPNLDTMPRNRLCSDYLSVMLYAVAMDFKNQSKSRYNKWQKKLFSVSLLIGTLVYCTQYGLSPSLI